jgi:hypothetical protein
VSKRVAQLFSHENSQNHIAHGGSPDFAFDRSLCGESGHILRRAPTTFLVAVCPKVALVASLQDQPNSESLNGNACFVRHLLVDGIWGSPHPGCETSPSESIKVKPEPS